MISKEPLRVRITTDHDAIEAIEAVEADGIPRVIERDGRPLAKIVSIRDHDPETKPADADVERALAAAGSWKGLGLENLDEIVYRWRHDSPDRPPINTE